MIVSDFNFHSRLNGQGISRQHNDITAIIEPIDNGCTAQSVGCPIAANNLCPIAIIVLKADMVQRWANIDQSHRRAPMVVTRHFVLAAIPDNGIFDGTGGSILGDKINPSPIARGGDRFYSIVVGITDRFACRADATNIVIVVG